MTQIQWNEMWDTAMFGLSIVFIIPIVCCVAVLLAPFWLVGKTVMVIGRIVFKS